MTDEVTNTEKLAAKLKAKGARIGGIALGDKPGTSDEIAGEILRAIESVERGDCWSSCPSCYRVKFLRERYRRMLRLPDRCMRCVLSRRFSYRPKGGKP